MDFVLPFASMIKDGACPALPTPPALPAYGTHKVCDFLNMMVRALSAYYGRV
jgi:arginyl-tRNA synthetase